MIPGRQATVLIYADDFQRSSQIASIVESAGWLALAPETPDDAVRILDTAPPDVCLLVVTAPSGDELMLLDHARAGSDSEQVPIVCLLDRKHRRLVLDAFGRRADDVIWGQPDPEELIARLRTRLERPPVPRDRLVEDPVTGALTPEAFGNQLQKEHERVRRGGRSGALAFIAFDELPELTERYGSRARDELLAQVVRLIKADGRKLDFVGWRRGMIAILLPATPTKGAQIRFDRLVHKIYEQEFSIAGSTVRLTPVIGFTETVDNVTMEEYEERVWDATRYQSDQLDLHPTRWVGAMSPTPPSTSAWRRRLERFQTPMQIISQQVIALALPFATYILLAKMGLDITGVMYLALVIALTMTATSILIECHAALRPTEPPPAPDQRPPPASAIIAAYLPNEAGTVVETVEAFLLQDYPDLEVILAYNTPRRLEVEDELNAIAARDPRFVPLRVEGSVSKAQNVNAALARVRGEFVGLFDADHHPDVGSFHRAWRWLAGGAGVVQGHCVIRNGDTNYMTRLVATEFEAIYAVAHPGRARLHGFGVFGGSNGYWRTSLLRRTRMRGAMLTEDIDSSMRVVQSGEVIISDPGLVSTELAPETFSALWNQRLRWAQGWSQVSLRHLLQMIKTAPTIRQRLGVSYLLGWREIYPWISLQMFPLLAFWWYQDSPPLNWFVPIFVLTTLLTFSVGPLQTWYSYRLAHPSIKQHRRWFVLQGFSALLYYTELKNVMARTAHLKELMRERKWKITPRSGSVALDAEQERHTDEPSDSALDTASDDVSELAPGTPIDDVSVPALDTPIDGVSEPTPEAPIDDGSMSDRVGTRTPSSLSGGAEIPTREPGVPVDTEPTSPPTTGWARLLLGSVERPRRHRPVTTSEQRRRHTHARSIERTDRSRPRVYDREREEWHPEIYDVASEMDGWPNDPPAVGATSSDESDSPRRSGERRSGSRRGRRSSDAVGRTSGPPIAVPIRLFEPDFQRQTIHSPSSDLTAHSSSGGGPISDPDGLTEAALSGEADSARPVEPSARRS